MSHESQSEIETWANWLRGESEQTITALRQIATHGSVTGCTADVVALSGSRDDEIRMWAAEALETSIEPAPSELPSLMSLLETSLDSEVHYWSVTMIGRLGTAAAAAAETLRRSAADTRFLAARERAVWALGQLGSAAELALPTLHQLGREAPPRLQRLAVQAASQIEASRRAGCGKGFEEAA